jgi:hypothetical protein
MRPIEIAALLGMVAIVAVWWWLSYRAGLEKPRPKLPRRPLTEAEYWRRVSRWLMWWALVALLLPAGVLAQDEPEAAYVTGSPLYGWLGLATRDGTYVIQLEDGCEDVDAGVNVLVEPVSEDGAIALRAVDGLLGPVESVCLVTDLVRISDEPCVTDELGRCNVSYG